MMTQEFLVQMTERWSGYWGVPVRELDVNPDEFQGLSREYLIAIQDMIAAVNEGHFGYRRRSSRLPPSRSSSTSIRCGSTRPRSRSS